MSLNNLQLYILQYHIIVPSFYPNTALAIDACMCKKSLQQTIEQLIFLDDFSI